MILHFKKDFRLVTSEDLDKKEMDRRSCSNAVANGPSSLRSNELLLTKDFSRTESEPHSGLVSKIGSHDLQASMVSSNDTT